MAKKAAMPEQQPSKEETNPLAMANEPAYKPLYPSLRDRFVEPFPSAEIRWILKEVTQDKSKCLILPYVTARAVMDRLDEVIGMDNWKTAHIVLPTGDVVCSLSVKLSGEWVSKSDVGACDMGHPGDRIKGAFSDSLKRVAVQFGIGRYLYEMPSFWMPYDARNGSYTLPRIPKAFLPKSEQEKADATPVQQEQVVPGAGVNGQTIPPVQLGGEPAQPSPAPAPPQAPSASESVADPKVLWAQLSEAEKTSAKPAADTLVNQSGPSGNRDWLLKVRREYQHRIGSVMALAFLEALLAKVWANTPGEGPLPPWKPAS